MIDCSCTILLVSTLSNHSDHFQYDESPDWLFRFPVIIYHLCNQVHPLCRWLSFSALPFHLSQIMDFSGESDLGIMCPKYYNLSLENCGFSQIQIIWVFFSLIHWILRHLLQYQSWKTLYFFNFHFHNLAGKTIASMTLIFLDVGTSYLCLFKSLHCHLNKCLSAPTTLP